MKRQFNSALYERLAISSDKEKMARLAVEGQAAQKAVVKHQIYPKMLLLEGKADLTTNESEACAQLQEELLQVVDDPVGGGEFGDGGLTQQLN